MAGLLMAEDPSVALPTDPVLNVDTLLGDIVTPTPLLEEKAAVVSDEVEADILARHRRPLVDDERAVLHDVDAEILRLADLLTGKSKGNNVIATPFTLDPGTYCGGLHITKNAVVTLRPGIYVSRPAIAPVVGAVRSTVVLLSKRRPLLFPTK
jgi:hypothetical protein